MERGVLIEENRQLLILRLNTALIFIALLGPLPYVELSPIMYILIYVLPKPHQPSLRLLSRQRDATRFSVLDGLLHPSVIEPIRPIRPLNP